MLYESQYLLLFLRKIAVECPAISIQNKRKQTQSGRLIIAPTNIDFRRKSASPPSSPPGGALVLKHLVGKFINEMLFLQTALKK